jgi:hypothetical protein
VRSTPTWPEKVTGIVSLPVVLKLVSSVPLRLKRAISMLPLDPVDPEMTIFCDPPSVSDGDRRGGRCSVKLTVASPVPLKLLSAPRRPV